MREMQTDPRWGERLDSGCQAMGLQLPPATRARMLRFLALLVQWNRAFNLTAVRDPLEMVQRHLLDSLSVLPYLKPGRILDIGTGPGLPGIPLALLRPDWRFVLLDSNGKKIRFVRQAVMELGLQNVEARHARVEALTTEAPFDTLITRAFASLPKIMELTGHLRSADSILLAMKGKVPEAEVKELDKSYQIEIIPLEVPFGEGERHLVMFSQQVIESDRNGNSL